MVSSKNCNGEAQMEDPFSTNLSARMLIPEEERALQWEGDTHRETETHTQKEGQRQTDRHTHVPWALTTVATAVLQSCLEGRETFMLINGVDLILNMDKSWNKNEGYLWSDTRGSGERRQRNAVGKEGRRARNTWAHRRGSRQLHPRHHFLITLVKVVSCVLQSTSFV